MAIALFSPSTMAAKSGGILAALALSASPIMAHHQISKGLPFSIVKAIATESQLDESVILALAGVDRTTYHRRLKEPQKPWSVEQGARIYMTVKVLDAAAELFNHDFQKAAAWLNKPAKALASEKPAAMLKTPSGGEAVLDLIGRISQGIIS